MNGSITGSYNHLMFPVVHNKLLQVAGPYSSPHWWMLHANVNSFSQHWHTPRSDSMFQHCVCHQGHLLQKADQLQMSDLNLWSVAGKGLWDWIWSPAYRCASISPIRDFASVPICLMMAGRGFTAHSVNHSGIWWSFQFHCLFSGFKFFLLLLKDFVNEWMNQKRSWTHLGSQLKLQHAQFVSRTMNVQSFSWLLHHRCLLCAVQEFLSMLHFS